MGPKESKMRLIGMMDSPYVRRVAISLKFMKLPFSHESISVFRDYDIFAGTNPVVKAPTLVTDDGIVLMDSTLILDHLERIVPQHQRLTPVTIDDHARAQRIIGLALAACEKTVQLVYEFSLRPFEKHHQPWIERVRRQLASAYRLLEAEIGSAESWLFATQPLQADITAAVAWRYTRSVLASEIGVDDCPALSKFSRRAEAMPEFVSSPLD
jgi:glutathione S-transferase